jgi:multiple sugar transport system permease protein
MQKDKFRMRAKVKLIERLFMYAIILVICFIALLPMIWIIVTSFKSYAQTFAVPPIWIFIPTLENYEDIFFNRHFLTYLVNSTIVASLSTLFSLMVSVPMSYALARFRFRRSKDLSFWVLSIRMFPPIVAVIPMFIMFQMLGLIGSLLSLIVAYLMMNIPLSVWMLRGFFEGVPPEIEESAMVDGCSRMQAFLHTMIPLTSQGLAATAILCFVFSWNEFIFALLFTTMETRTLPVSVTQFIQLRGVNWGPMCAASVCISIPVIIFAVAVQKYLIRGLTLGAVKG